MLHNETEILYWSVFMRLVFNIPDDQIIKFPIRLQSVPHIKFHGASRMKWNVPKMEALSHLHSELKVGLTSYFIKEYLLSG